MNNPSYSGHVLLADVGGTHVRFAMADAARSRPLLTDSIRVYDVGGFSTFADAARRYIDETRVQPQSAVFAIAGPVDGDVVRMTNHPWTISRAQVRSELSLGAVDFINDFAAMSLCIPLLAPADMHVIGSVVAGSVGASRKQTFAVVGPGTGLGVGALVLRDGVASALESEGGHIAFAPGSDQEIEILRRLQARFGRVSYERLLSGSGLTNLHRALGEIAGGSCESLAAEEITRRAADGSDPRCVRATDIFCVLLGALAGDCVLAFGAWDGVYLVGGMAPIMLAWLGSAGFRRRFEDKGRFAQRLASVPSMVVMHPQPGLLGAAAFAVQQSGRTLIDASAARDATEE